MNLQQLRYAHAISECGSFVEAARRCAVTQPTLSNGLAQLEADLGQALFLRTTRSVGLTEFGRHILPSIADVLNAQAALIAKAKSLSNPTREIIRIGVSPILSIKMVEMIVETFLRSNPIVEVVFREINLGEMFRLLEIGQLEFVFGPIDPSAKPNPDLCTMQFHEEPLVLVSKGSPHAIPATSKTMKDIADDTFIMVPDTCGLARVTRGMFRSYNIPLKEYAGEAMSYRVLEEWAQLGIGNAILPASKVMKNNSTKIVDAVNGNSLKIAYQICWRNNLSAPPIVTQFSEYLRQTAAIIAAGLHVGTDISASDARP